MSDIFMKKPVLGIVGGLGPSASALFYSMITKYTKASCDSEHIDTIIYSVPSIPDRTDFILGKSDKNPLPEIIKTIKALNKNGADIIAIPCNTAEYFNKEIELSSSCEVLNIVEETAKFAFLKGIKKAGILSTRGTLVSKIYEKSLSKFGISFETPDESEQEKLDILIYDKIKKGIEPEENELSDISKKLFERGCEYVILGCTELSLSRDAVKEENKFIDSLMVLALSCIKKCGHDISNCPEFYITK